MFATSHEGCGRARKAACLGQRALCLGATRFFSRFRSMKSYLLLHVHACFNVRARTYFNKLFLFLLFLFFFSCAKIQ